MNGKTPTSVLTEIAVHYKVAPPRFETVSDTHDPKVFICIVRAFDTLAKGTGHSKNEAKHAASQVLIDDLSRNEPYKSKIGSYSYSVPPRVESNERSEFQNNDAIGNLMTCCQRRQIQLPSIDLVSINGADHKREFTYSCRIGINVTVGIGSTKKEARQNAASQMLKLIDDSTVLSSDSDSAIGSEVTFTCEEAKVPTVEESLAEYRRLKKTNTQSNPGRLRHRQNFFMEFPLENRCTAATVFQLYDQRMISAQEAVDHVFSAFKIKYEVKTTTASNIKVFCLMNTKHDCVIMGKPNELFEKVINHLKIMLNFDKPVTSASSEDSLFK